MKMRRRLLISTVAVAVAVAAVATGFVGSVLNAEAATGPVVGAHAGPPQFAGVSDPGLPLADNPCTVHPDVPAQIPGGNIQASAAVTCTRNVTHIELRAELFLNNQPRDETLAVVPQDDLNFAFTTTWSSCLPGSWQLYVIAWITVDGNTGYIFEYSPGSLYIPAC